MRSLKDLLALAEDLRGRGIGLVVLEQQIGTTTPQGGLCSPCSAPWSSSRESIVETTNEGLASARARGRTGGRKPKLTASQIGHARELYAEGGKTIADIAAPLGVSRQTNYRSLEPEDVSTPAAS